MSDLGHLDDSVGELDPGDDLVEASLWSDAWRQLRKRPAFWLCAVIIGLMTVVAIVPGLFTSVDPRDCNLRDSLLTSSSEHWFGTDLQGCDYYSRVVHGARVSMLVGVLVTTITVTIALTFGSIAGYFGGIADTIIARFTDMVFAIPFLLGAIVMLTVLDDRFPRNVWTVSAAIGLWLWPTMLRLVRSSVLSVKEAEYVDAARALGASNFRIITKQILPNAITPLIVFATLAFGGVIVAEATLSFLGVGLRLPSISWGLMIAGSRARITSAPHLLLFPGGVLLLTALAFVLLGDILRDALDPKLR